MDVGGAKELGRDTEVLWTGKNQWSFETMGGLGFKRKTIHRISGNWVHSEDCKGFL